MSLQREDPLAFQGEGIVWSLVDGGRSAIEVHQLSDDVFVLGEGEALPSDRIATDVARNYNRHQRAVRECPLLLGVVFNYRHFSPLFAPVSVLSTLVAFGGSPTL